VTQFPQQPAARPSTGRRYSAGLVQRFVLRSIEAVHADLPVRPVLAVLLSEPISRQTWLMSELRRLADVSRVSLRVIDVVVNPRSVHGRGPLSPQRGQELEQLVQDMVDVPCIISLQLPTTYQRQHGVAHSPAGHTRGEWLWTQRVQCLANALTKLGRDATVDGIVCMPPLPPQVFRRDFAPHMPAVKDVDRICADSPYSIPTVSGAHSPLTVIASALSTPEPQRRLALLLLLYGTVCSAIGRLGKTMPDLGTGGSR
jgi:hypothetical protein